MAGRVGWLLAALALGIPGLVLGWATMPVLRNGGFLHTERERLETPTHALVFAGADDRAFDADSWSDGEVTNGLRIEARSVDGKPLFVGVARADQVLGLAHFRPPGSNWAPCPRRVPRGYLEGVPYHMLGTRDRTVAGARWPIRPDRGRLWADAASGTTASADWEDGPRSSEPCRVVEWYPVVMNVDGSAGVQAEVRFGARVTGLAVVGTIIAALLLAAAALLGRRGLRRA